MYDLDGNLLDHAVKGQQQVILSSAISNQRNVTQSFVVVFEVRDSDGSSVYVGWQNATLAPKGQMQVGMSWLANVAGDYDIRTVIVSSLANPIVLAEVTSTMVSVQDYS
ncbi:MAG: hypothetical protein ABI347_01510 [Nitrososphaera sp.]|jgi:hypothetical protein